MSYFEGTIDDDDDEGDLGDQIRFELKTDPKEGVNKFTNLSAAGPSARDGSLHSLRVTS